MFVGVRPTYNVSASNPNQYRDWHRLTLLTDQVIDTPAQSVNRVNVTPGGAWSVAPTTAVPLSSSQQTYERTVYPQVTETVDTLSLTAHAIKLYDALTPTFFRDYTGTVYGGPNINTADDVGAMMINFCLYPGTYQPSGHMNISRSREFNIQYTSSYITSDRTAEMIVLASAMNFLLVSDGSAVLRYST